MSDLTKLDEIMRVLQVTTLDIVGDEFAPKQEGGSPERQRLLGLTGEIYEPFSEAKQQIKDLMLELIGEVYPDGPISIHDSEKEVELRKKVEAL